MLRPRIWWAVGLAIVALGLFGRQWGAHGEAGVVVSGVVVNVAGERVGGAVVRQRATSIETRSASDGAFALSGVSEALTVVVTAWQEGYFPGGVEVVPPAAGVTITLRPHPTGDNPDHTWYTSMPDPDDPIGCGHCMVAYPQWVTNAHAASAVNPRFFSLYNGTDLSGTTSLGGGYKDDFPGTAGNCATCHAPGAAVDAPFTADMNELSGVETEGVFCDFCHKVAGVYLNAATGLPYQNAPGVTSMWLTRPPSDTHMFYGPFDDVLRRVSYLKLEKQSEFCAPCHQFSFWGVPVYTSFEEWLESPYPAQGVECQGCHMVPTGVDYFVYPEQGGLIRDPDLIASHLQPGAADVELLRETLNVAVNVEQGMGAIDVTVAVTNTGAGHHVPTDHPGRHVLLTVQAQDADGRLLSRQGGPQVPAWGGAQAGLPGKAYAKVLQDVATGAAPVVSYWKPTRILTDTRLPAMGEDISRYAIVPPRAGGPVTVTVELRFRRVFQEIADLRGWAVSDIVMATETVRLETHAVRRLFLPVVTQP
jgi:hypothetical protein